MAGPFGNTAGEDGLLHPPGQEVPDVVLTPHVRFVISNAAVLQSMMDTSSLKDKG